MVVLNERIDCLMINLECDLVLENLLDAGCYVLGYCRSRPTSPVDESRVCLVSCLE